MGWAEVVGGDEGRSVGRRGYLKVFEGGREDDDMIRKNSEEKKKHCRGGRKLRASVGGWRWEMMGDIDDKEGGQFEESKAFEKTRTTSATSHRTGLPVSYLRTGRTRTSELPTSEVGGCEVSLERAGGLGASGGRWLSILTTPLPLRAHTTASASTTRAEQYSSTRRQTRYQHLPSRSIQPEHPLTRPGKGHPTARSSSFSPRASQTCFDEE